MWRRWARDAECFMLKDGDEHCLWHENKLQGLLLATGMLTGCDGVLLPPRWPPGPVLPWPPAAPGWRPCWGRLNEKRKEIAVQLTLASSLQGWLTNTTCFSWSIANHLAVNGAWNTVVQFVIELGQHVFLIDASFTDVLHGSLFDDVSNDQFLYCLVFWYQTTAIRAVHWNNATTAMFASTIVTAFLCHPFLWCLPVGFSGAGRENRIWKRHQKWFVYHSQQNIAV